MCTAAKRFKGKKKESKKNGPTPSMMTPTTSLPPATTATVSKTATTASTDKRSGNEMDPKKKTSQENVKPLTYVETVDGKKIMVRLILSY